MIKNQTYLEHKGYIPVSDLTLISEDDNQCEFKWNGMMLIGVKEKGQMRYMLESLEYQMLLKHPNLPELVGFTFFKEYIYILWRESLILVQKKSPRLFANPGTKQRKCSFLKISQI